MTRVSECIYTLNNLVYLGGASIEEITLAEKSLQVSFSPEFNDYLATFGALVADGVELTGIAKSKHRHVVLVTEQERSLNPLVPKTMYVIERLGVDGLTCWQDSDGVIYQSSPNRTVQKIANSLVDYLVQKT